jgi:predicted nucleotidyltransferase
MTAKPSSAERHGESPQARIPIPYAQVAEFCRRNRIRWLALFGSVLRDDFGSNSDVDVLAEFEPEARVGLIALGEMQHELSNLFARPVDLVLRNGLKRRIRDSVLASAQVIYAN